MENNQSWFNEYQQVEDYIIDRIGGNFLDATPEKFKTASEATIDLLEKMYTQKEMTDFADEYADAVMGGCTKRAEEYYNETYGKTN